MGVPYTFGTATTSIPLSNLDANFNTPVTIGSTGVGLGNTTTTLAGLSNVSTTLLVATTANITTQNVTTSNLTNLTVTNDASISGLTVGKGGGAVATNTVAGIGAFAANTTGADSVAVGRLALRLNTTGIQNTAIGSLALYNHTTGNSNTAIGYAALIDNTTGSDNVAVGLQAADSNTTGSNNTAIGRDALQANTTASNNTAVGYQAGYSGTTAQYNTFVGMQAGYGITTGSRNTFVGNWNSGSVGSGSAITTGSANVILGAYNGNQGGLDIRTASNHIVLSDGDGNPRGRCDGSANWTFLDNVTVDSYFGVAVAAASTAIIAASAALNQRDGIRVYTSQSPASGSFVAFYNLSNNVAGSITHTGTTTVAYNTSSDYRLKENITPMTGALAKVAALKPCTYTWKEDGTDGEGFIAHELAEVCPQAVTFEKDAVDDEGNPKYQGVDTSFLVATLTASIQELKAIVDAQAERIAVLESK